MRPIDADELMEKIRDMFFRDSGVNAGLSSAIMEIGDAPTLEMEPVRRGEWISVTEIHEAIMNHIAELEDVVLINGYAGALRIIHNLPTVDAEPVRYGQWINHRIIVGGFAEEWGADCSCCGKTHVGNRTPYCPNCGARMDGEDNGQK